VVEGEVDLHWRSERTIQRERALKSQFAGEGWLEVERDGTISIVVEDDFYSGSLTREQSQKLYLKLREVFGG
jgi:hypothetical protein